MAGTHNRNGFAPRRFSRGGCRLMSPGTNGQRRELAGHERDVEGVPRPGRVVQPFVGADKGAELLSAGVVSFPANSDSDPHMHAVEEEILYVIEGEGALVCDGVERPLEPGAYVFVPPGVEHFVRNSGNEPIKFFYAFSPPVVIGTW
jgi:mannose-6-phosphate isomerase-like protein (cupin superfamily)